MSCEICKTLEDFKKALHPELYIHGAEKDVARAIDKALDKHTKRCHKK